MKVPLPTGPILTLLIKDKSDPVATTVLFRAGDKRVESNRHETITDPEERAKIFKEIEGFLKANGDSLLVPLAKN